MEIWDAYDKNGKLLGFDLIRGAAMMPNVYHMLCDTVVRHRDGTFLLMQRAMELKAWPGMFQVGAGGHAVKGETPTECAMRELEEESGIISNELKEMYTVAVESEQAIYHGFLCETDCSKNSVCLQEGETIAYRWVSKEEFIGYMESDDCMDTQKTRLKKFVELLKNNAI